MENTGYEPKLNAPGDMSKIGLYLMAGRLAPVNDNVGSPGVLASYNEPCENAGYVSVVHLERSNMGLNVIEPHDTANAATSSVASNIPFNLIPLPDKE